MPFAAASPFLIKCYTDHTPLTWLQHTSGKGPVSQFLLDTLSEIDYELYYIKGPDNIFADSLSRFPMLGPRKLQRHGLDNVLDILLASLITTDAPYQGIWFNANKDTDYMISKIHDWIRAKAAATSDCKSVQGRCHKDSVTLNRIDSLSYGMAIWAPPADKITRICAKALRKGTPFACLIPNTLVDHICVTKQGSVDKELQSLTEKAQKIAFLSPELTWLIHGINELNCKQVAP